MEITSLKPTGGRCCNYPDNGASLLQAAGLVVIHGIFDYGIFRKVLLLGIDGVQHTKI